MTPRVGPSALEGVKLCRDAWKPLLESPQGQAWYRPFGSLGEDDLGFEQDNLTEAPAKRAKLALQIPESVVKMYAYWLAYRMSVHERHVAKTMQRKVGRNEPCPCRSGNKFKKCCGAAANLYSPRLPLNQQGPLLLPRQQRVHPQGKQRYRVRQRLISIRPCPETLPAAYCRLRLPE